jgi:hypothetical protein
MPQLVAAAACSHDVRLALLHLAEWHACPHLRARPPRTRAPAPYARARPALPLRDGHGRNVDLGRALPSGWSLLPASRKRAPSRRGTVAAWPPKGSAYLNLATQTLEKAERPTTHGADSHVDAPGPRQDPPIGAVTSRLRKSQNVFYKRLRKCYAVDRTCRRSQGH